MPSTSYIYDIMLADFHNQFGLVDAGVVLLENNQRFLKLSLSDKEIQLILNRLNLQMSNTCPRDEYLLWKNYYSMLLSTLDM